MNVAIIRCPWPGDDPLYLAYHDEEWGVPVHDDRLLFEFLILEGAQAGLSWITILRKREAYREAFDNFDPQRVAAYDEAKVAELLANPAWVAVDGPEVLGFVLAPRRFSKAAEITFAAVMPSRRNSGIGKALVEHCLAELAALGVSIVEVKTLDASANFEPYVATRAFWERRGFIQIDCIDPLPGWDPGNPSAIYARSIP